eukprot:COSAG04_NODE_21557_length_371_cov_1.125000_1_plen_76_part_10
MNRRVVSLSFASSVVRGALPEHRAQSNQRRALEVTGFGSGRRTGCGVGALRKRRAEAVERNAAARRTAVVLHRLHV